jgi:hypothetical protein
MPESTSPVTSPEPELSQAWHARSLRALWLLAGAVSLATGIVGAFLPLLPTTPFVLLAAFCFSRGSRRWEHWLLHHPRLGPMVRDWRANRAVPLRAKQLATVMMTASSLWAWWVIPSGWRWLPAACCATVAAWLWSLPTRPAGGSAATPPQG